MIGDVPPVERDKGFYFTSPIIIPGRSSVDSRPNLPLQPIWHCRQQAVMPYFQGVREKRKVHEKLQEVEDELCGTREHIALWSMLW